jgi:hypothetical protein
MNAPTVAPRRRHPERTIAILLILVATAMSLAACAASGGDADRSQGPAGSGQAPAGSGQAPAPSRAPAGSLAPAASQPVPSIGPADGASPGAINLPASIIDPVVAEIARVAGVPVDAVVIVSAQPVTFPDAGLGCPVPGMAYPQVQVDGYRIVARTGATEWDYRGTGASFRRCG